MNTINESIAAIKAVCKEMSAVLSKKFGTAVTDVTLSGDFQFYVLAFPKEGKYVDVKAGSLEELEDKILCTLSTEAIAAAKRKEAAKLLAEAEQLVPAIK